MVKDLSKEAQLRGFNKEPERKIGYKEKDALMKYIICALDLAYECPHAIDEKLAKYQDEHIKNKASHPDLRYKPSNHQLLKWDDHSKKTDSGKYTDLRHPELKRFLSKFDCLFISGKGK